MSFTTLRRSLFKATSRGNIDENFTTLRRNLFKATSRGDIVEVKRTLDEADPKYLKNILNYEKHRVGSALSIASKKGYNDIVKELLSYCEDTEGCIRDKGDPLYHALKHGHIETAEILLDLGLDPWLGNSLYFVASEGTVEMLRLLTRGGKRMVTTSGWNDKTPCK